MSEQYIVYGTDDPSYVPHLGENNTFTGVNTFTEPIALSADGRVEQGFLIPLDALGRGATAPSLVRLGNFAGYEFDIGDDGYFNFEVPYSWDSTTPIFVKIHWYIDEAYATASGEIKWNIDYTACAEGIDTADGTTASLDTGDVNIPATAKTLTENEIEIPANVLAIDDVVGIKFTRAALTGGTNPTAKPTVIGLEIGYTMNKLGEAI